MKIISLGSACQVKYNIDRLFKTEETNFFDWLVIDFKAGTILNDTIKINIYIYIYIYINVDSRKIFKI